MIPGMSVLIAATLIAGICWLISECSQGREALIWRMTYRAAVVVAGLGVLLMMFDGR